MAIESFGIPLAYVITSALVLWVLIAARGRWWLKAAVTVLTLLFGIGLWLSLDSLQGWPVEAELPGRFEIKWLYAREPDKKTGNPGVVYVWAVDIGKSPAATPPFFLRLSGKGTGREPRLYRLAYSRRLHEQAEEIQETISGGGRFFASLGKAPEGEEGSGGGRTRGGPSTGGDVLEGVTGEAAGPVVGTGRLSAQDYIFYELPPPRLPEKGAP